MPDAECFAWTRPGNGIRRFYLLEAPMSSPAQFINCSSCGTETPAHSVFCCKCGNRVAAFDPASERVATQENPSRTSPIPPPPLPATPKLNAAAVFGNIASRITSIAGVERLEGLNRREFFSEALRKRTDDDVEELFITGTRRTTPLLSEVDIRWPKPWAFFKAFLASSIAFAGFLYGVVHFENANLVPGLIFIGSFAIPLSTLILFMELNVSRNISLYQVFKLVVFGGIASLLFSLFLFSTFSFEGSWGGALAAGIVEEAGKLGAVLLLMRNSRFHWTLNGMLLGAAVGTGFAAFESAGYALTARFHDFINFLGGSETNVMYWTLGMRALLTPAGHIAWTGLTTAALWRVKNEQQFNYHMMKDSRFLRVFVLVVCLHVLWDAPIGIPFVGDILGEFGKYTLLGLIAWIVVLSYVQIGLKQIRAAQTRAQQVQA
jgi:RsiW-degrading membrane proteinase PrsW (M82 family)